MVMKEHFLQQSVKQDIQVHFESLVAKVGIKQIIRIYLELLAKINLKITHIMTKKHGKPVNEVINEKKDMMKAV